MKYLFKLLTIAAYLGSFQSTEAGMVTFQDSTFENMNWESRILLSDGDWARGSGSSQASGGSGDGAYRRTRVDASYQRYGPFYRRWLLANMFIGDEYDIQKSGPISSIEWSLDFDGGKWGDAGASFFIVLEQANQYYTSNVCCMYGLNYGFGWATATDAMFSWQSPTHIGLKEENFYRVGTDADLLDYTARPDFSRNGSPIRFGYVLDVNVGHGRPSNSGGEVLVDNMIVRFESIPEPSSALMITFAAGLICTVIQPSRYLLRV